MLSTIPNTTLHINQVYQISTVASEAELGKHLLPKYLIKLVQDYYFPKNHLLFCFPKPNTIPRSLNNEYLWNHQRFKKNRNLLHKLCLDFTKAVVTLSYTRINKYSQVYHIWNLETNRGLRKLKFVFVLELMHKFCHDFSKSDMTLTPPGKKKYTIVIPKFWLLYFHWQK